MFIYSIFDRVAGVYGDPIMEKSDALAIRRFQFCVSRSPMIALDCDLFKIGEFDEVTGVIKAYDNPVFVRRFEEVKD